MQQSHQDSQGDRLGQEDDEVRAALRFAAVTTVSAVGFLVLAAVWVSMCGDATAVDTAACGAPERMLLALMTPLIFLCGGLWAFVRTYQVWRNRGTWWGWQGAGWFLLAMMILILMISVPPMISPVLGS